MPQSSGSRRYNDRAGLQWQAAAAQWLRNQGIYPHAESTGRWGERDLTGTGDVSVECTVEVWANISTKTADAELHARVSEPRLPWPVVWKRRQKGKAAGEDIGRSYVVMEARNFWSMVRRLEDLEAREMDVEAEFERGFRLGRKKAVEEARA
jgi:hypothetical protein